MSTACDVIKKCNCFTNSNHDMFEMVDYCSDNVRQRVPRNVDDFHVLFSRRLAWPFSLSPKPRMKGVNVKSQPLGASSWAKPLTRSSHRGPRASFLLRTSESTIAATDPIGSGHVSDSFVTLLVRTSTGKSN